jgi:signal transduction histidine kinase
MPYRRAMPEPRFVWKAKPEQADAGDSESPADAAVSPADVPGEIRELRAKIAFLEKKLNIVGSVTRHDVLNQLTAVAGYTELLGMMIEDEKIKSYLEKETQAVDKIRRQFQFAKDYQNIAVEPPRWQNLNNTLHRVMEQIDTRAIRITGETGQTAVYADILFEKVYIHLFENTLRHGGTATEIHIGLHPDGDSLTLVVEDNGTGIADGDREKIFERGYGKGTGWGLFLAREILAATGATIRENGVPGKGVRFEIRFPPGTFREGGGE